MDDIHGLKPFMFFTPSLWPLLLGLLGLAAAWLVARWWRARRRPSPSLVPAPTPAGPPAPSPRSALRQLDELVGRGLVEADRPRELHAALSMLMRGYLGARFELPARRMTTTELLAALANRSLDERVYRQLADLLPGCDLAKFAGFRPSAAEMEARLLTARGVIEVLGDLPIAAEDEEALAAPARGGVA